MLTATMQLVRLSSALRTLVIELDRRDLVTTGAWWEGCRIVHCWLDVGLTLVNANKSPLVAPASHCHPDIYVKSGDAKCTKLLYNRKFRMCFNFVRFRTLYLLYQIKSCTKICFTAKILLATVYIKMMLITS